MKKICIDARMIEHSGIGTYLKNLIPLLSKGDLDLTLIVSQNALKTSPWLLSYPLIFCEDPIYSLREQIHLPQLIPPCDLFWSPHFNAPLFPIRAKKRLITIHDLYHLAFFSQLHWMKKIYARIVISQAMRKADRVVTVSLFTLSEIEKFFPKFFKKTSVVYCGVSPTQFSKVPEKNEKILSLLPQKYFLFVGNVKPHKNLLGLLQAFQLLAREKRDVFLVIVGKGFGKLFEELMERFGNIREKVLWLKNIPDEDLPMIYHRSCALVFPSVYEGFGLPPLEAMASSCPVIASRIASIPEICEDAALYIDPYDPLTMKDAMVKILGDTHLRQHLIASGKKRIEQFSWKKSAAQHLAIIEELLHEDSTCS